MTYDKRCYELAQVFLWDQPGWFEHSYQYRETTKEKLAQEIQRTIEDFIVTDYTEKEQRK